MNQLRHKVVIDDLLDWRVLLHGQQPSDAADTHELNHVIVRIYQVFQLVEIRQLKTR